MTLISKKVATLYSKSLFNPYFRPMPGIDKIIIDRVLEEAKIEEVVGEFVTLKKKGVRYIGCCPFHKDRHAGSFVVYPAKECYKCFVCGASGDVIGFVQTVCGLSRTDAMKRINADFRLNLPISYNLSVIQSADLALKRAEREKKEKAHAEWEETYHSLWAEWIECDKAKRTADLSRVTEAWNLLQR